MFSLRTRGVAASSAPPTPPHVANAHAVPRVEIGPASEHLRDEMLKMYWDGVRRELPHIMLTLKTWQSDEYANPLPDEEDTHIHGYDTFVDQVSHSSRHFARRYRVREPSDGSYAAALEARAWDLYAQTQSESIKQELRNSLDSRARASTQNQTAVLRRRARILLQAAQFLDMDKVIEYRPAVGSSKRPVSAQLAVVSQDETSMPIFGPQLCLDCHAPIRGSLFKSLQDEATLVCEGCYRDKHYGDESFTKVHKHSILDKAVSPQLSRSICSCLTVQRIDADGEARTLFPIDPDRKGERHLNQEGKPGRPRCGLVALTDMAAEAKFATTRLRFDKNITLAEACRERELKAERLQAKKEHKRDPGAANTRPSAIKKQDAAKSETAMVQLEPEEAYDELPSSRLQGHTDSTTYGNLRMALRFGTLFIENGVENMLGGTLITNREPPSLHTPSPATDNSEHSLLVTGQDHRLLSSQNRLRSIKRYQVMMKQVVGGAFCGFFDEDAEESIVDALITESQGVTGDGINMGFHKAATPILESSVNRLLEKLQAHLAPRVLIFITSLASRLIDPSVNLGWDSTSNPCPTFCDSLIDRNVVGPLLSPTSSSPLYLLSFVCRPSSRSPPSPPTPKSKHDVPPGLTQSHLQKLHAGLDSPTDLLDTLASYWHDWGCFDGPLYPHQDLFPWDCTAAYNTSYPLSCGDCNLSKHVWAFPFDAWSLISLHLARARCLYPSTPDGGERGWFTNRLRVLLAQQNLLTGAVVMARSTRFREATVWLHQRLSLDAEEGDMNRVRLGGIHRAQPESGEYHAWFVAPWAGLTREARVREYERLRGEGVASGDVGGGVVVAVSSGDGGEVWGGLGVGVVAAGGDTCGSGCVSSEPGDGGGDGCGGGCGGCAACG